MLPKPVLGNFDYDVPGNFELASTSESHISSSRSYAVLKLSVVLSELSSFINADQSSTSTRSQTSVNTVDEAVSGTLSLPIAQPNANGNSPSDAERSPPLRRAVTLTTLYGVPFHCTVHSPFTAL